MEQDKFAEGDKAIEQLKKEFKAIVLSSKTFQEKVETMTEAFQKAAPEWNLKGDDRVLSMMSIEAGSSIDEIADAEIKIIEDSQDSIEEKRAKLESLKKEIDKIPWLAEGFKSSLNVKITFSSAGIKLGVKF